MKVGPPLAAWLGRRAGGHVQGALAESEPHWALSRGCGGRASRSTFVLGTALTLTPLATSAGELHITAYTDCRQETHMRLGRR